MHIDNQNLKKKCGREGLHIFMNRKFMNYPLAYSFLGLVFVFLVQKKNPDSANKQIN